MTTDLHWDTSALDLDAYLERIGVQQAAPSLDALGDLIAAHVRRFPFENIDVLLDQHQGVDLPAVQAKFLGRERGGYCFEHATLFHAVLARLGYEAVAQLGRVGDPQEAARTHLVVIVELDGRRWLADPGIGIPALGPLELSDGYERTDGVWPYRMVRASEGRAGDAWQMWRRRTNEWELQHSTDELPARRIDVRAGHHWTSTWPDSHFRSTLMVNRQYLDTDGTAAMRTITETTVTEGRAGEAPQPRDYELSELPELLASNGVRLSEDELARLTERLAALRDSAVG